MLKTSKKGTGKRYLSCKPTRVGGDKSQCGSSPVVPVAGGRPVLLQKPGLLLRNPVPVTVNLFPLWQSLGGTDVLPVLCLLEKLPSIVCYGDQEY